MITKLVFQHRLPLLILLMFALAAPAFAVIKRAPKARQRQRSANLSNESLVRVAPLNLSGVFKGTIAYPDGDMRGENAKLEITEATDHSPFEYVGTFKLTLGAKHKEGIIRASTWESGKSSGNVTINGVEIKVRPNRDDSDSNLLRLLNKRGEPHCFRFCPAGDRGCIYPPPASCKKYVAASAAHGRGSARRHRHGSVGRAGLR